MLIADFFEDQEIFITGGSGFIGKALIEKLLRSCPKIGKIFVLLRSKHDKNATERLHEILNMQLFNRARQEQPQAFQRVLAVEGDCSEIGLGISAQDLQKLQNVTIIYHSAACVRFDEPLRNAILLNTRGTHELVKMATELKYMKVFLHVSTAYCNPENVVVDEKVYPPYADWRTSIRLAETYTTTELNIFNVKYSGHQPNTYTFTKSLAEQIINDYKDKLPMLIFRPSIVTSSSSEPVPGWSDNFNGPIGFLLASAFGILRTSFGNPDTVVDLTPVDVVVRSMLVACYKKGIAREQRMDVVNCAHVISVTNQEILDIGTPSIKRNPLERTLWMPGGSITRCWSWHMLRFITLQIFVAIIVDCVLRLKREKPFLLKLQRKIYFASVALHYFMNTSWVFKNANFQALEKCIPKTEQDTFSFMHYAHVDTTKYLDDGLRGSKVFLLNESPNSSKQAHVRFRILQVLHYSIQLIGSVYILRLIIQYIYAMLIKC